MIEVVGNLWDYPAEWRVITTNGTVKKNGHAVMGRGCAKEAMQRYPLLPALLGNRLRILGNHVNGFIAAELRADRGLFTFPVKHEWMQAADPQLIARSVAEFKVNLLDSTTYVMPRPGCGNGNLRWEDVRPLLVDLPDNVFVIDFGK